MYIVVCCLLSYGGYYVFKGRDVDGWLYYELWCLVEVQGLEVQENLFKEYVI